jgi:DNA repair exonuclease SbcCD nuclease subunit
MSKIVVVSDLHLSNRKSFAKQLTNPEFSGCNSRFHEIAAAFRWAVDKALEVGAEALIVPGDIYHERGVIPIPVLNAAQKLFKNAASKIPLYLMVGNHDVVSSVATGAEQELHSLFVSKDICNVIAFPATMELDSFHLSFIPFTPSREATIAQSQELFKKAKKSKKPTISFFHHSFDGALTGPHEWSMPFALKPDDIPDFDLNTSGHVHMAQNVGKIRYMGTLIQQDMGERTYPVGLTIIDSNAKYTHVENKISPRFVISEATSTKDIDKLKKDDYNYVQWDGDPEEGAALRGNDNLMIEILPQAMTAVKRTTITTVDSVEDMITKYAKAKVKNPQKKLIDYGINLFRGV